MSIKKHLPGKIIAGMFLGLICCGVTAQNFTREIQLAKALNEIGLTDYADDLIEGLLKSNPGNELLSAQRINNLLAQNKTEEAMTLAKKFAPGTDAYYETLASIGVYYVMRLKFDEGIAQLAPVMEYAAKSGKVANFKKSLLALMTAYQKAGKAPEAQKVLEVISMSEKGDNAAGKRDMLYSQARFGLDSVEDMQKRQKTRWDYLNKKITTSRRLIEMSAEERTKLYAALGKKLSDAASALLTADPTKGAELQKLLAAKKTEDEKYYDALKTKKADAVEANAARLAVYEALGSLVGLSSTDSAEMANMARIHTMNEGALLKDLWAKKSQEDGKYYTHIRKGGELNAGNYAQRANIYKDLGRVLGLSESESMEYAAYSKVLALQPERRRLISKGYHNLLIQEKEQLDKTDPMDWQDVVYTSFKALDEVLWAGQDVLYAMAVAQSMRANYYIGNYAAPLSGLRKYRNLFKLCDEAYKKDKEFGIEASPAADAKMWEGYLSAAYAQQLENSKDAKEKQEALKYYKRAFVAFGNLLKNYPKHKDGAKNYPEFLKAAENVARLEPGIAAKLQVEIAKVKKPENQEQDAEVEELVQPIPEEAFKTGSKMASELIKREHSPKPPTEAEWNAVRAKFKTVATELEPVMADKRLSTGLPKVLRYLTIANGYLGDVFRVETLTNLGKFKFRDDPLVQNGVIIAGNALWLQAERLEKAGKVAEGKALKQDAASVYGEFLDIARSHEHAPLVAIRLAREDFINANNEGAKLNQEKNPDARAVIRHKWITGFDNAVKRYAFVINNFSHRPEFIDEAFERSIEAYVLTKRYEQAVELGKKYCANGSENPARIITAKMDIAANLYSQGGVYEKEAMTKKEEAVVIVIPTPVKPEPPAAAPAAAPAVDPQVAYQEALTKYEEDVKTAKILTEKRDLLNKEAEELTAKAHECYKEAITHINELTNEWLAPKGPFASLANAPETAKNKLRAASLLPWLYDGCGDVENAVKMFEGFIATYPQEKTVPQYLMRLSVLYTEADKTDDARRILNKLSTEFRHTPEGRNAKFSLAHNLYTKGNYGRALTELHEIFSTPELKQNLTVSNYRFLASELVKCRDPQYAKAAASYAQLASEELLRLVKTPNAADWVGDLKAKEFAANPKEAEEFFALLYEKLLADAAVAASAMGDFSKAATYYTSLEKHNKNTPYLYQMYFGRADAYLHLKKYEEAKQDLVKVGRRANLANQTAIYNKAQTMLAGIWELQYEANKDQSYLNRAYALYSIVAALPFGPTTVLKVDPDNPEDDTPLYLERAVYKSAELAGKLGKTAEKKQMVEKYQKYYPDGRYKVEVRNLAQ